MGYPKSAPSRRPIRHSPVEQSLKLTSPHQGQSLRTSEHLSRVRSLMRTLFYLAYDTFGYWGEVSALLHGVFCANNLPFQFLHDRNEPLFDFNRSLKLSRGGFSLLGGSFGLNLFGRSNYRHLMIIPLPLATARASETSGAGGIPFNGGVVQPFHGK